MDRKGTSPELYYCLSLPTVGIHPGFWFCTFIFSTAHITCHTYTAFIPDIADLPTQLLVLC